MKPHRRLIAVAAIALTTLLAASSAHAAGKPHLIDPAGDTDASCGILGTAECGPTSQPVVDLLAVDFSSPHGSLITDVTTSDIEHELIGGTPQDSITFRVTFIVGDAQVSVVAKREALANSVEAYIAVATLDDTGSDTIRYPVDLVVDPDRDRLRFEAPLSVYDAAVHEICTDCAPMGRGTELERPGAGAQIDTRDGNIVTPDMSVSDNTSHPAPSYYIGH